MLVATADLASAVHWYTDVLGLRIAREYGVGGVVTGVVLFLGGGFLELTGPRVGGHAAGTALWLQVPDVDAEHARLVAAGVAILQPPTTMPWGLRECELAAPEGTHLHLVEIPEDHPIRRRVD